MTKKSSGCIVRKAWFFLLFAWVFLAGAPSCRAVNCDSYPAGVRRSACYIKQTYSLDVTTTPTMGSSTTKPWFKSGAYSSELNTGVKCDGVAVGNVYYQRNYCGNSQNSSDNNWLNDVIKSDDLDDDSNFNLPVKNFIVKASASVPSGDSIKNILIQWSNNTDKANAPTSWDHSYTCNNAAYCKLHRDGVVSSGGVIPVEDISVRSDGTMNVLWFKVTITSTLGASVVIGGDNISNNGSYAWSSSNTPRYLDRYYQLQICNDPKCNHAATCTGTPPIITSATASNGNCAGGGPYTFSWTWDKGGQYHYILNIYDTTTGYYALWSYDITGGSAVTGGTSYSVTPPEVHLGTGGVLNPNHTYRFEVRLQDNNANADCKQWSAYKTGTFTTCTLNSCTKTAPTAYASAPVAELTNMCSGGLTNKAANHYQLNWGYDNMPAGTDQTSAVVSLRQYGSSTVKTHNITGNAKTIGTDVFDLSLVYGQQYEWKVSPVVGDGAYCSWALGDTAWKAFTVTSAIPPSPSISSIRNASGECASVACRAYEDITFGAASSTALTSPSYAWTIDGSTVSGTGYANYARQFTTTGTKTASLSITSNGYTCSASSQNLTLNAAACQDLKPNLAAVTTPSDSSLCTGLSGYKLNWGVLNQGDATLDSYTVNFNGTNYPAGTATSWSIDPSKLSYGTTYPWKVTVNAHNSKGCTWAVSSATVNLSVPNHYPDPNIGIRNGASEDCTLANACHVHTDNLTFSGSTSAYVTAGSTYVWKVEGTPSYATPYTGLTYAPAPFTAAGTRTATLSVTESGKTCSESKPFALAGADCASTASVALDSATNGDFCVSGLSSYWLSWTNSRPADYAQYKYVVRIRDADNPADIHTISVDSGVESFRITSEQMTLAYNQTYDWQVDTYLKTADGICAVGPISSPWSNSYGVSKSFNTPVRPYPIPRYDVTNLSGTSDCLDDECAKGEMVKFDASDSTVDGGATYSYTWKINGTTHVGQTVSMAFIGNSVDFSLTAKEDPSGPSCATASDSFNLGRAKIRWSEIAP